MSKTKKAACGYSDKPTLPVCGNCARYASELAPRAWMVEAIQRDGVLTAWNGKVTETYRSAAEIPEAMKGEANKRCTLHGFAVKKMGNCKDFTAKDQA